MQDQPLLISGSTPLPFPFQLSDLLYWVVKRKDGTTAKFVLVNDNNGPGKGESSYPPVKVPGSGTTSYTPIGKWCNHKPVTTAPIFTSSDGQIRLFVGDSAGAKASWENFDFVIDGGDVIKNNTPYPLLQGDEELVTSLMKYSALLLPQTRLLKIDWLDRHAPDVVPEFWVDLAGRLSGDVMTCCQGGHGRSGSAAVCLMMVLAPDYSAKDAIIHLRANHCPRAIESKDQHAYLNDVAKFLGRPEDAFEAENVKDYKAAFAASTRPTAIKSREGKK